MARNYDWTRIRLLYEGGMTPYKIAARYLNRPSAQGIRNRAKKEGWLVNEGSVAAASSLPGMPALGSPVNGSYDPETVGVVLEMIGHGSTEKLACEAAGITQQTLIRWKHERPQFIDLLKQARARKLTEYLANIDRAAATDWKASQTLLEKAPEMEDWKPKQQGDGGVTVVLNIDRDPTGLTAIEGSSSPSLKRLQSVDAAPALKQGGRQ